MSRDGVKRDSHRKTREKEKDSNNKIWNRAERYIINDNEVPKYLKKRKK